MTGRAILTVMRRICVTLAVAVLLTGAPPAMAQSDDEVYLNPDSPSGVEYDLPLERARRDADPDTPAGAPVMRGGDTPTSSPRFGEGISSPSTTRPSRGGTSGRTSRPDRSTRAGRGKGAGRSEGAGGGKQRSRALPEKIAAAAAQPVAPAGGGSALLLYGGAGALVVGAGALAGLAVRRRRDAAG